VVLAYCETMVYFFNVGTKMPVMQTYHNEHNMLLNFSRCLSILLLQTSKTDNNALDIDAIYNLKLTKFNTKFPWPPIIPKQRESIYLC
jgi:hypothetical protein